MASPFLTPGPTAEADSLAVLHLRRDHLIATILKTHDDENLGYDEGKVTTTRFGSFPHSTLIGSQWGSQIIASKVDTGSRGRRPKRAKAPNPLKRKAADTDISEATSENQPSHKTAVSASSGFIHILQPTPESWTSSLPHRTQVVYTPDSSYILHRLRVRPGSTIIEAGAGSGSFTHASARAVFSGYPSSTDDSRRGKVCSFEFHSQRVESIRRELREHGLDGIVRLNHRDVCEDGFLLADRSIDNESPRANAIFLDLPAPWLALKHLVREPADGKVSPLDPSTPVHICTFSPCLEQAQQTISTLRQYSWLSISMVEVAHKQIEVRRERYGVESDGKNAPMPGPKCVDQAVSRLRTHEERAKAFRDRQVKNAAEYANRNSTDKGEGEGKGTNGIKTENIDTTSEPVKSERPTGSTPSRIRVERSKPILPTYKQGTLIHRPEPELKTHTSYLVFAILPCTWSEEDEKRCREKWPSKNAHIENSGPPKSKKQLKREAREERRSQAANASADVPADVPADFPANPPADAQADRSADAQAAVQADVQADVQAEAQPDVSANPLANPPKDQGEASTVADPKPL
ncbi:tRNA (adenine-N(1)-)-methyltransferase catalytic subunit trm61 [Arthroderma sp. PD_2]|nr:tRNA (adenine-N(1)-)-methyltransferase catalytic subunit trm61 [Arthroderma sp. PD_2]